MRRRALAVTGSYCCKKVPGLFRRWTADVAVLAGFPDFSPVMTGMLRQEDKVYG
jgi:hypothetical protein